MTRIKSAAAILVLILVMCILSVAVIHHEIGKIYAMTENITVILENGTPDSACDEADSIISSWNRSYKILSLFVRRDKLSSVYYSLVKIKPLIENDSDEIYAEIRNIQSMLEYICNNEIPSWYNIF